MYANKFVPTDYERNTAGYMAIDISLTTGLSLIAELAFWFGTIPNIGRECRL